MRKIENELEFILETLKPEFPFPNDSETASASFLNGKVIIDVGCGAGKMVRALTAKKANVVGMDTFQILTKAKKDASEGNENYTAGLGQNLPFKTQSANVIFYFASFHHIPGSLMNQALSETHRVLDNGGISLFIEPVGRAGSYFELVRLVEDERNIQEQAFDAIQKARSLGLKNIKEEMIYWERSLNDYLQLLEFFVTDETKRKDIALKARKIASRMAAEAGQTIQDYRFQSICRFTVLKKA